MAVRVFQFSVVFAIGFCFGPAAGSAVASSVTEIPLSLYLKDPENVTVGRGQPATLKCEVNSSKPGLDVSWLYEGSIISVNDSRRQLLGDGSLYIPKVTGKRMEGRYQCLASNEVGAVISNAAELKIATIGRDFIEQPKNVSVTERQPVLLTCRIQSTPDVIIRWERDNKPLPHSTRYVPLPSGALLITSTHSSDAGFYRCIATNRILNKKTKHSKPGQLIVLPNPRLIEPPNFLPLGLTPNVTVLVGNNLTLYCPVTGWPTPTIQWLNNLNIVVGNSSVLDLRNVSADAAGNYSCSAYNSGGRNILHYHVNVLEPPHFNVTPVSISYPSARTVRLDCQVKGIPPPKIQWLKNGELLQTVGRIKKQQSGLVLSHSFTTDAGLYQCIATNSAGRAWVSAQLIPYFSENRPSPPQNVQCRPFDDNSICLTWNPPANITIQAYSIYAYSAARTHDFVTNYTHYLASGLDSSTNYTVYVRSYSKEASDQSNNVSCKTGIKGKRSTQVEYFNKTSVKVTWSEMSNDIPCGRTSPFYKVQWKRIDQSSVNVEHTTGFKKIISGLRPSSTYIFRIQSTTNKNDESPWVTFSLVEEKINSKTVVTTTTTTIDYTGIFNELNDTLVVLSTPQQVEATPLSPYSINLTWANTDEMDGNYFYTVCYVEVKEEKSCEKGQYIKSDVNYLEVKNLKPNTMYEFKVRTQNLKGSFSPFSHSVEVQTSTDIPSSVQDLKYNYINSTTVCIRWRTPLHKNGNLIKYVVSFTQDQSWPLDKWQNIDIPVSQVLLKNCWPDSEDAASMLLSKLKPHLQYTVLVRAVTEAGIGQATNPINFTIKQSSFDSSYPDTDEETTAGGAGNQDELLYKQNLGVALGVSISILCILCCVSCIIFRRRCIKREALTRARLAASNNYYPSNAGVPYSGASLQLRHQESCTAEAHEMQHLVGEEGTTHIPPITPTHLDTKGGVGFPNGQLNGTLKHSRINGHIANGHVHITENPRYDYAEFNGHVNPKKPIPIHEGLLSSLKGCSRHKDQKISASTEKLGGSNQNFESADSSQPIKDEHLQNNVHPLRKPSVPYENGGPLSRNSATEIIRKVPDYNSNCNHNQDNHLGEMYNSKKRLHSNGSALTSKDVYSDEDVEGSKEDGLNVTQLTCLEDSFTASLPTTYRKVSPALGPNG